MVSHLEDDELRNLPRGGHDYKKLYAAYKAATENLGSGRPTVILAKTIKGWTLGEGFEGRNATHQIKKMTRQQILDLRERLHLQDEIPEDLVQADNPPYFRPADDSIEYQYLMERRKALGGSLPKRSTVARRPISMPVDDTFAEMKEGSGGMEVSTTMGFTRLLRSLCRDPEIGKRVVPIIPDELLEGGNVPYFKPAQDSIEYLVPVSANQPQRPHHPRHRQHMSEAFCAPAAATADVQFSSHKGELPAPATTTPAPALSEHTPP